MGTWSKVAAWKRAQSKLKMAEEFKGWQKHFNSHTKQGRFGAAVSTLGLVSVAVIYKKLTGGGAAELHADSGVAPPFPEIKSKHSLVAKHVTAEKWAKLGGLKTKTSGFTLGQAIACAVQFDDQHCGIYAGDGDSYKDFAEVFDPIILEYHGLGADFAHTSDMDVDKIQGNVDPNAPVKSTRIRVGRSIEGFGLSPGITREQRQAVEKLMINAFAKLEGELAGTYYPLLGMEEATRQQLVDDHFLFVSGDKNLIAAGMEREWPEGRGIFHNKEKTFLTWVNEEDQLRIISMQKGEMLKEYSLAW